MVKIITIVGARPQFVKAAVWRTFLKDWVEVNDLLIDTGQHYDKVMSYGILEDLNVAKPEYSFNLTRRSHAGMLAEISLNLEEVLKIEKPDWLVVFGDTDSALAATITAVKLKIHVAHIEAGLRSGNFFQPEEINRKAIDHLSSLLFCPTIESFQQAQRENLGGRAYHSGDIMYDCVKIFDDKFIKPKIFNGFIGVKKYVLLTLHRKENIQFKEKLQKCLNYVRNYCEDIEIVFPCHPHTRNKINVFELDTSGIKIINPLKYTEMQFALKNASMLFTDSGGMQKEAYFHRVQCVTLREETEWIETIQYGWNRLWTHSHYLTPQKEIIEYGDGFATTKIIEQILKH